MKFYLQINLKEKNLLEFDFVLKWYLTNPIKTTSLFYHKSIYFWSPWYGPVANGTMARNPWLTINPLKDIATTQDGLNHRLNRMILLEMLRHKA